MEFNPDQAQEILNRGVAEAEEVIKTRLRLMRS